MSGNIYKLMIQLGGVPFNVDNINTLIAALDVLTKELDTYIASMKR